ncbi:MAG: hypothetical protein P8Z74_13785, partial [Acidobacteriota bacterium]
ARQYRVAPHSMLLYFYYIVRVGGLLRRWSRSGLKLLLKDPAATGIAEDRARVSCWLSKN